MEENQAPAHAGALSLRYGTGDRRTRPPGHATRRRPIRRLSRICGHRGARDQALLLFPAVPLDGGLTPHGAAAVWRLLLVDEGDGAAVACVAAAPPGIVGRDAPGHVRCPAGVIGSVGAAHDVYKGHGTVFLVVVRTGSMEGRPGPRLTGSSFPPVCAGRRTRSCFVAACAKWAGPGRASPPSDRSQARATSRSWRPGRYRTT
jgi:hypothetical protein